MIFGPNACNDNRGLSQILWSTFSIDAMYPARSVNILLSIRIVKAISIMKQILKQVFTTLLPPKDLVFNAYLGTKRL